MMMLAVLALGISPSRGEGSAPVNPLGDKIDGLQKQYLVLRDTFHVDASEMIGQYSFEIDTPPLFLDLGRQEVGSAWKEFVSSEYHSQCLTLYEPTVAYGGQCKKTLSALRDALQKYSALYPPAGDRYHEDPFDIIQEDIAHQGYSRNGNMVDRLEISQALGESYYQSYVLPWVNEALHVLGEYGDKHMFGKANNPQWLDYVLLKGSITNEGTPIGSQTPFYPRFGSEAIVNKQFWGLNAANGAKQGFDGYENLGLLFRVQLGNAFGDDDEHPDADWHEVMGYDDLTLNKYGSYVCELKFHDLRKIIRMMWRTMTHNPQIVPLNFMPQSIDCAVCAGGKFPALSAPASEIHSINIGGRNLMQEIFRNNDDSRAWLRSQGWNDALISLSASMALGGFYHLDYNSLDPTVTLQYAEDNMDSNEGMMWDFVQRMGYIHDLLLQFTLQAGHGLSEGELQPIKDKVNGLWAKFVDWCSTNEMLDLLKYKLDPYLPVGNETAVRDLTPSLPVSNLPFMIINTNGKKIPCTAVSEAEVCDTMTSAQRSVNATLALYEFSTRDEPVMYNISIKAHGESSRGWPKKTYGFEFWNKDMTDTKDTDFLGMPSNDEWVLKGFYVDMTLNRDAFAYNLSRAMHEWAPRTQQTEIYMIDDNLEQSYALHYKGVYTVCEKISRGKNRVVIPKNGLKKDPVTGEKTIPYPAGEGGYIFTVDKFNPNVDKFTTLPITGNQVQIKYPGRTKLQPAQMEWAWERLHQWEEDMFKPEWLNTGQPGAWDQWIDLDSWAQYFIHAELMKSVDAYRFSTYFYTEGGNNTLKFGPPWDYDLSSANTGWVVDLTGQVKQTHSWQYMWARTISNDNWGQPQSIPQARHTPNAADWFYRMLDVPEFKNRVSELFWQYRQVDNPLNDDRIREVLRAQKLDLRKGSNRNFAKWATLDRVDIWPHYPPPIEPTLDGRWEQLENYVLGRVHWMEENIHGYLPHDTLKEGSTCDPGIVIPDCLNNFEPFPAPYTDCNFSPYMGFWWVRSNWQSSYKFFYNQSHAYNDGTDCSVLEYLHWEFAAGLGPVDCPVPGGPSGLLPAYYDPATPMSCNGPGCGVGTPGMTQHCAGTIEWLKNNWHSSPKYAAGGVDGSICSCQRYLNVEEDICPPVRGPEFPMFCVQNRCQRTDGTSHPTQAWTPTVQPTPVTGAPTTLAPTAPGATSYPTSMPTTASPTRVPSTARPTVTFPPSIEETHSPTHPIGPTAAPTPNCGTRAWCDEDGDGGACENEKDGSCDAEQGLHRVADDIPCDKCDLSECCSKEICYSFTGKCGEGMRPKDQRDDLLYCVKCDATECCVKADAVTFPTSPPSPPKKQTKKSNAGGVVAAVIIILLLLGVCAAAAYIMYQRQQKAKVASNFISLNSDVADYHAPAVVGEEGVEEGIYI